MKLFKKWTMSFLKKGFVLVFILLLTTALIAPQAYAQNSTQSSTFRGIKRNIATVFLCGLGGAILGLSTLSFYGQPQEQVGNITTGFGVGLIAGTVYIFSQNHSDVSQAPTTDLSYKLPPLSPKKGEQFSPLFAYSWSF